MNVVAFNWWLVRSEAEARARSEVDYFQGCLRSAVVILTIKKVYLFSEVVISTIADFGKANWGIFNVFHAYVYYYKYATPYSQNDSTDYYKYVVSSITMYCRERFLPITKQNTTLSLHWC